MLHELPEQELQPFAKPMTKAVQACVHCGFCLADCPTYQVLGREAGYSSEQIAALESNGTLAHGNT